MTRSPLAALAATLDRRIGRAAERPSVWNASPGALLSHVAVIAFGILTATGLFLVVWYDPSTDPVAYQGASELYAGQELPAAFASVIRTSEDVPGGMLTRRVHAAAAHLLLASLFLHLWRILATGAARRPRTGNHLIGMALLLICLGAFYTGELLPFSLVSGASLRIGHAVLSSTPVVGEPLARLVFGGEAPTGLLVERSFWLHVVLLPGGFVSLTALHLWFVHRHSPTAAPHTVDPTVVTGEALWPDFLRRLALLGGAVTAVVAMSAALIPWSDLELEGPFLPAEAANTLHPPWPLFFLSGALRIMPPVDVSILGVRIGTVLLAGLVVPALMIGALAVYPFVERRWLGDDRGHHVRDGLLDVPLRAGVLAGLFTASVLLSLAATVDVMALHLRVPVEWLVQAFRLAVVVGPPGAGLLAWWYARRRPAAPGTVTGPDRSPSASAPTDAASEG